MLQSRDDMKGFDIIVIGGGVMGAATACEAARRGAKVALIEQAQLPNPRAASVDHSKVFRFAYPDALYAEMAARALKGWRMLERETGARLITPTGLVMIAKQADSFEARSYDTLRSLGLEAEILDSREVARRFPQFNPDAFSFAVVDPSGAILHAERAVRAFLELAKRLGVTIVEGERVIEIKQDCAAGVSVRTEPGKEFICKRLAIASGPWTRKLLPELSAKLTTTRQEIVYFKPSGSNEGTVGKPGSQSNFAVGAFPIFIELESGFYGFPVHHDGAMKIANHHKGEPVDPYSFDEQVGDEFIARCRTFFSEFMPALTDAEVAETRVCIYNNTPDDDFIIDWHKEITGALIVTGFSGHGFKFGPAIGRIGAELLLEGNTSFDIERFKLARFDNKGEVMR
jgi:monomeric sarcosine oxidase